MSNVLITGVTGQDGTYLARNLIAKGAEVHGIVRPESVSSVESGVQTHKLALSDSTAVTDLIRRLKPEVVFHLAGQTSVAASWADPVGCIAETGTPTAVLLKAISDVSPQSRFVNASSAEIFGFAEAPQNESTAIRPVSPYGAAKALGYFLVQSFRAQGLKASSAVLYNHESPIRPERFVSRKITKAVAQISRGKQDKLVLGNLDAERDWGWAPDVVEALQLIAASSAPEDFVIGTGQTHSVREFVSAAFSAVGIADWEKFVEIDKALIRPVDPAVQVADSAKARTELGWEPTVSFEEIVQRMVEADLSAL